MDTCLTTDLDPRFPDALPVSRRKRSGTDANTMASSTNSGKNMPNAANMADTSRKVSSWKSPMAIPCANATTLWVTHGTHEIFELGSALPHLGGLASFRIDTETTGSRIQGMGGKDIVSGGVAWLCDPVPDLQLCFETCIASVARAGRSWWL
jgi:hypothetical protein